MEVYQYDALKINKTLQFFLPPKIIPKSANEWDDYKLYQLQLNFIKYSDVEFLRQINPNNIKSEKANNVITKLTDLSSEFLTKYDTKYAETAAIQRICENTQLSDVLIKSMFLSKKYSNNESLVDNFLVHLFLALGFYDGMLFAVPQMNLNLTFSDTKCRAVPDFVIMDILSYCRMAVFEEKSISKVNDNSLPQLIAEAIATYQLNKETDIRNNKRLRNNDSNSVGINTENDESRTIYGIQVNGLNFTFYKINISEHIEQAMNTSTATNVPTDAYCTSTFDFLIKTERESIITILDCLRQHFEELGQKSQRKNSKDTK